MRLQRPQLTKLFLIGIIFFSIMAGIAAFYLAQTSLVTPSQISPSRDKMKKELKVILSNPPSPEPSDSFPKLKVQLPPVGEYCNGCYDAPPGWSESFPDSQEKIVSQGEWVTGGFDTSTSDRKWSYIYYVFKGLFPELPKNTELILPEGNFLQDAVKIPLNDSKKYVKLDPYKKVDVNYTYKKLSEVVNKEGIKIYTFEVRPTFDEDSVNRKDAIFTKDNHTVYIMFDWKEKKFDSAFDKLINSINFE